MTPRSYAPRPAEIENLARGIAHGPYPDAPQELIEHYIDNRDVHKVALSTSNEQLIADVRSSWQYDQHSSAVMDALEEGTITPIHAVHMLSTVLRPWYIGTRNKYK